MAAVSFDFARMKQAFETLDIPTLIECCADHAEWIEYKPGAPPSSPRRLVGKEAIHKFVQGVADYGVKLLISNEVIGDGRIAYCMSVETPDGRRGIEHVIAYHQNGKITRQIDVEAWD